MTAEIKLSARKKITDNSYEPLEDFDDRSATQWYVRTPGQRFDFTSPGAARKAYELALACYLHGKNDLASDIRDLLGVKR